MATIRVGSAELMELGIEGLILLRQEVRRTHQHVKIQLEFTIPLSDDEAFDFIAAALICKHKDRDITNEELAMSIITKGAISVISTTAFEDSDPVLMQSVQKYLELAIHEEENEESINRLHALKAEYKNN